MKHNLLQVLSLATLLSFGSVSVFAQREQTPVLDRGVVAVKTSSGVFVSWRIPGEEYYDVTYNLYRNGSKINDKPLSVSNYQDNSGSSSDSYSVAAVVRGVEQAQSSSVSVLSNNFIEFTPTHDGSDTYQPNDATIADLDGDGQMELLVKFVNTNYHACSTNAEYLAATEFDIIEAYKLDGTRLWWIDCGPNMTDFQSNEINIAAYDWDGDGMAECILRAADNTIIHKADGSTVVVGDPSVDTRGSLVMGSGTVFTHTGGEYLLYLNGLTADVYVNTEFPLKRLEDGETDLNAAWGDGYGHRSSKFFFGAPYFDGKTPSIFLARGIYTRHKMIAYDVDPSTHSLSKRWSWNCSTSGSPWYGQGYHNYSIADVDWDGRDEIVFGSMVIDDNGKGLSTTGLGHGDAHHVGDFDPYKHGQEVYACNEDAPCNNYRDATTSQIYYRLIGSNDDGRSIAGNFSNSFIGASGLSARDGAISCVTAKHVDGVSSVATNFRIYWDGDLQEETFNYYSGKNSAGAIYKCGTGEIARLTGSLTNNDTKGTPCLQADMFGDWREEVVMRTSDNKIRIFTTTTPTEWRNYTLLDDHQYRNQMLTQMNGYNQPPHVSYFLGELEGITIAPPPAIMTGRVRVDAGATISSALDDKHILLDENADAVYTVSEGVKPYIVTVNTPSWVQGNDNNDDIVYTYYTHTLKGAGFSGDMRLVKQGDGTLVFPDDAVQSYTGETNVWAGSIVMNGQMSASPVWLNRFATLTTDGGVFNRKVSADYAAVINIAGDDKAGSATFDTLQLNFGARLNVDLYDDGSTDVVKVKHLILNPASNSAFDVLDFNKPVVVMNPHPASGKYFLSGGKYLIAEFEKLTGSVDDIALDGRDGHKATLVIEDNKLYVNVEQLRDPETIYWTASESNVWNLAETENFVDAKGNKVFFVSGDDVVFDDRAASDTIVVAETLKPGSVRFANNSRNFILSGDSLVGSASFVKGGYATTTVASVNHFTGGTTINAGTLAVSALAYSDGDAFGALGGVNGKIIINSGSLATSGTVYCSQQISLNSGDTINVTSGSLLLTKGISGSNSSVWYKAGYGSLSLADAANAGVLHILLGNVNSGEASNVITSPGTVYLEGGNIYDPANIYSYSTNNTNYVVPEGMSGLLRLDERCNYKGTLTGAGTITVAVAGPRANLQGDWSKFTGTVKVTSSKTGSYDPYLYIDNTYGLPNAKLNLACNVDNNGKSMQIGRVDGSSTMYGSGTWTIGTLNEDFTFSATINGGKFAKGGSGKITMKTLQTSVGDAAVSINAGALILLPTDVSTKFFKSNAINVNKDGALYAKAALADVNVNSGALFVPGNAVDNTASGVAATANTYLFGGTIRFNIKDFSGTSTSSSSLTASSQLYVESGTIEVTFGPQFDASLVGQDYVTKKLNTAITNGKDSVILWTAKSVSLSKSNITVNLPELPDGFAWDTSDLFNKTGILRLVATESESNAIPTVFAASDAVDAKVFDLSGVMVAHFATSRANVEEQVKSLSLPVGLYVVNMSAGNMVQSIKVLKD